MANRGPYAGRGVVTVEQRGQPDGHAPLAADSRVPRAHLPASPFGYLNRVLDAQAAATTFDVANGTYKLVASAQSASFDIPSAGEYLVIFTGGARSTSSPSGLPVGWRLAFTGASTVTIGFDDSPSTPAADDEHRWRQDLFGIAANENKAFSFTGSVSLLEGSYQVQPSLTRLSGADVLEVPADQDFSVVLFSAGGKQVQPSISYFSGVGQVNHSLITEQVVATGSFDLDDVRNSDVDLTMIASAVLDTAPGANGEIRLYQTHRAGVITPGAGGTGELVTTLVANATIPQDLESGTIAWPGAAGARREFEIRLGFDASPAGAILIVGSVQIKAEKAQPTAPNTYNKLSDFRGTTIEADTVIGSGFVDLDDPLTPGTSIFFEAVGRLSDAAGAQGTVVLYETHKDGVATGVVVETLVINTADNVFYSSSAIVWAGGATGRRTVEVRIGFDADPVDKSMVVGPVQLRMAH